MTRKAVIFDLDGTLVDTAPDLWRATNHCLSLRGRRDVTLGEVRAFVGHGARKLIARGLAATGEPLGDQDIEALYEEFVAYYSDHIAMGSVPFPGCLALLDRLKAEGIGLGICTNKLEGLSTRLIDALGMRAYSTPSSGRTRSASPSPTLPPIARRSAAWRARAHPRSSSATAKPTC